MIGPDQVRLNGWAVDGCDWANRAADQHSLDQV